ncbi:hypothetical protein vBSmQDWS359_42 [Stenotrophomonas phage vB_Sm_QDWS359]|uniref:Uncharacterized protein n=1 Tax=Stenotrophomonas phage vB_Sm_QDWS359 TaxID=2943841 RepID=A0A9E7DL12_9CAUD|nr:hypothetical protein P9A46_gp42 [Stenotrophomonas phage vB_Sm_QDWS359]UQM93886.1 hypothetical protein vBSmQDWS359_42 [Stenotrophomonas phage vB_Sm_QDWS359]
MAPCCRLFGRVTNAHRDARARTARAGEKKAPTLAGRGSQPFQPMEPHGRGVQARQEHDAASAADDEAVVKQRSPLARASRGRLVTRWPILGSGRDGLGVHAVVGRCGFCAARGSRLSGCPLGILRPSKPGQAHQLHPRLGRIRLFQFHSDRHLVRVLSRFDRPDGRGCSWWTWRESNPRPNAIRVASYSHRR